MAERSCNLDVGKNAQLEPIQSYWLYENMKHLVWIVKIMKKNGTSSEETIERFATGFCLPKKKRLYHHYNIAFGRCNQNLSTRSLKNLKLIVSLQPH